MVVEQLTFRIEPHRRAGWLAVDAETWGRFLGGCAGMVRRDVLVPVDRDDEVVVQVWWEDRAAWSAVDPAVAARLDAQMGDWYRPAVCRELAVVGTG